MGGPTLSYGPTNCGSSNTLIVKTNLNGDTVWSSVYAYTGYLNTSINQILQTQDCGYIALGSSQPSTSGSDVFLLRLNALGDTLWTRTYGGQYYDVGTGIASTIDKGFIIVGQTNSFGSGINIDADIYVIKIDSVGNILWSYAYGSGTQYGWEYSAKISQTSDHGFFLAGFTSGSSFGTNPESFGLKLDSLGNVLWCKIYGGVSWEFCNASMQTKDGGYLLVGSTSSYRGGSSIDKAMVIKTDQSGNVSWTKTYEQLPTEYVKLNAGKELTPSGYILTGNISDSATGKGRALAMRIDSNGNQVWSNSYCPPGVSCIAYDLDTMQSQEFIFAGYMYDGITDEFYVVKSDSNGNSCDQNQVNFNVQSPNIPNSPVTVYRSSCSTLMQNANSLFLRSIIQTDLCSNISIEELNRISTSIHPNPASKEAKIVSSAEFKEIRMTDILGMEERTINFRNYQFTQTLDLSNLPNGIYFITVTSGKESSTQKLVVQH